MSAGYSGKPLAQKLGIKKGDVLVFSNAPDGYDLLLGKLPDGVTVARELEGLDFVQLFATERASLEGELPKFPQVPPSSRQGSRRAGRSGCPGRRRLRDDGPT